MELEQAFGQETPGKVDRIIALTERVERIERAANQIKYNNELVLEIPEALKTLGAARDAVIAELKTL
jgi:hypothetical protein